MLFFILMAIGPLGAYAQKKDSTYFAERANSSWSMRNASDGCQQLLDLTREFSTDSALRYPKSVRIVFSNAIHCIQYSQGPSEALPLMLEYQRLAYTRCPSLIPWYHFNMGKMLFESSQNDSLLEHLNMAFDLFAKDSADHDGLALTSEHLAGVYMRLGDPYRSLKFRELALRHSEGNKWIRSVQLLNLSVHHMKMKDFVKAREYVIRQIELDTELGRIGGMPYVNLMNIDAGLHASDEVIALDYASGVSGCDHDPDCKRYANSSYANILIDRKQYQKALGILARLDSLNQECQLCDGYKASFHWGAARCHEALGHTAEALRHLKEYLDLNKKINYELNRQNLLVSAANFEFSKKKESMEQERRLERALAEDRLRNERLQKGLFLGFSVMLLVLALLIWRNLRNQKRYSAQIESQKLIIEMEHQRSENLLLNILPATVAEELKQSGTARAQQFDEVTILFTDFKGFTTVSEQLTPSELVSELHECFSGFDAIMQKHGIEKIKTVGDAYLAVCGLPRPDAQHAEKVCRAALEVILFMQERRQRLGSRTFEVRVGINTGPVVAGIVGHSKFAYDIWGDAVNTAARMEQNSESMQVNISESTYQRVRHIFSCTYRGEIEAKNKGRLKMYFLNATV